MITQDKILIILLAITCSIILAEIKYDKTRWKAGKSDKPISTILRAGLIALFVIGSWICSGDFMSALKVLGVILGTYFLVFDFALNVSRWKRTGANFYERPFRPYYRPFHTELNRIIDDVYWLRQAIEGAYAELTTIQKLYWNWIKFESRFFYHGKAGTKPPKYLYDHIFQSIPWGGELLFKGTVFGVLIWFYYS